MCIAVPGKLIEIAGTRGKVDVRGNILPVELGLVQASIGDYLLIHAGCAISVVPQSEAEEIQELLDLVESYNG
jgi:hydrogenase expression/formation protein HypC